MCIGNRARSVVAMTGLEQPLGARKPLNEILPGKFGPPVEIGVVARPGARWKDWVALIAASHRSNIEQFIHTGRLITAAKDALPHGEFGEMIKALPFSARMAQIYMTVAADARITNAKHISHLPAHIGTLYEISKLQDAEFEAHIADGTIRPDMERRDIATAVKQARRAARERELGQRQLKAPDGKFGIIVADPEWHDEVWGDETGMDRHAANHYPTSAVDVIASRDVPRIAAKDSVLFLWTTNQHLRVGITVMEAWGFAYKSNYAWGKDRISLGRWQRGKHELLLIGTRGEPPCPAPGTQWESLLIAPKGEHSAKPECFLEMIEGYYPTMPKIELNRRGPTRPGWVAWGNEVTLDIPSTPLLAITARACDDAGNRNEATQLLLAPPTTTPIADGGDDDPRQEGDGLDIPEFLQREAAVVGP
jgi:N6-adenosine-specific RNA methylase IME4